ncbi:MAG: phosphatase PAP2 family protein, partial [Bacilli bacterium]|nr:phosphatase PAP2 family protein [Bacilli bacterium]
AALGIAFYGGNHVASYVARALGMGKPWWLSAVYGVAFALLFSVPAFFVPQTNPRGVLVFVIMFAILFVTILVLYQGIKLLWLRPRWRTLVALQQSGAIDSATNAWIPFYQPQGFWNFNSLYVDPISESQRIIAMNSLGIVSWGTEEFVSFPSGHVINVTALTSLSMMSLFMPKLRGKERYVRFGVYAFAALVAFTRILCGAHYLSDVAFGFAFSVLVYDLYSTFLLPVIAAKFLPMPVLPNDEATES